MSQLFDGAALRQRVLEHLVKMAREPGWKAYAWHAAKHYEEINPQNLAGIQEELKQHMQQEKEQK